MKKIIFSFLVLISISYSNWILKIDNKTILRTEFENYLSYQQKPDDMSKQEYIDGMLDKFINDHLVVESAKKLGFNNANPKIIKQFDRVKDAYILKIYYQDKVTKESGINEDQIISEVTKQVTPAEVKKFYNEQLKAMLENPPPYEKLESADISKVKEQLIVYKGQQLYMEKLSAFEKKYMAALQQKIKVRKFDQKSEVVAKVGEISVTKLEVNEFIKMATQQGQTVTDKEFGEVLDNIILKHLIKIEIDQTKYIESAKGKSLIEMIYNNLILNAYLEEIAKKNKPTEAEFDKYWDENLKQFKDKRVIAQITEVVAQKLLADELQKNPPINDSDTLLSKAKIERQIRAKGELDIIELFIQFKLQDDKTKQFLENQIREIRDEVSIKRNSEEIKKIVI